MEFLVNEVFHHALVAFEACAIYPLNQVACLFHFNLIQKV